MRFIIVFILTFLSQHFFSQGFRSKFTLPNSLSNTSKAVFETSPGNYFAAGIVVDSSNGYNFNRLVIMGLNQNGQLQWTKKYGNIKFEYLHNILISRTFYKHENAILYAGCVRDSSNKYIGVLIKFDFAGDTLWQKTYRTNDTLVSLIPQMLTHSEDGGFLITGFFESSSSQGRGCMVIKTDANGNEIWRKSISKVVPNVADGKGIIQDSASKKIAIVGYQYIGNSTSWNSYDNILILDSLGNKLGQYHFVKGLLRDIVQTQDKKFIAVGNVIVPYIPNYQDKSYSYAVKFDINNPSQPIWKITNFDKLGYTNSFNCLTNLPNGNVLLAGIMDTSEDTLNVRQVKDRFTVINPIGQIVSNTYYNYAPNKSVSNANEILTLSNTSDGGWITASRWLESNSINPFFFVKYDSTGCDSSAAYCATVNLVGVQEANKNNTDLYIFPNPAQDQVQIQFSNSTTNELYRLQIYNSIGQIVREESIHLAGNNALIQTKELPNGMYTLTFSASNKGIRVKKLVIAR